MEAPNAENKSNLKAGLDIGGLKLSWEPGIR